MIKSVVTPLIIVIPELTEYVLVHGSIYLNNNSKDSITCILVYIHCMYTIYTWNLKYINNKWDNSHSLRLFRNYVERCYYNMEWIRPWSSIFELVFIKQRHQEMIIIRFLTPPIPVTFIPTHIISRGSSFYNAVYKCYIKS